MRHALVTLYTLSDGIHELILILTVACAACLVLLVMIVGSFFRDLDPQENVRPQSHGTLTSASEDHDIPTAV